MSCYMVGHDHIDALVTAAASVCHGRHDSGLSWFHNGERFHLSYSNRDEATNLGQMLMSENEASVCFRYDDCEPGGDLPGTVGQTDPSGYEFRPVNSYDLPPETQSVVILKALSCYEYQTCEHPGWASSSAKAFCEALRHKMIEQLPGYMDADAWEFERASVKV